MMSPRSEAVVAVVSVSIMFHSFLSARWLPTKRRAESRGQPADLAGSSIHGRAGLTVDGGAPGVRQLASRREGEQGWRIAP
jgi:hypothetical protein